MIGFLKRRRVPRTGARDRLYVIGDIHGRFDLLRELLARIEAHATARPLTPPYGLVLLGDLIDRGENSAEVLRYVRAIDQRAPRMHVLLGNHEEAMLRAYDGDHDLARLWMRMGGDATLRSFGIEPFEAEADIERIVDAMREGIPADLIEWMRGLPLTAQSGDYLFCHAGVRPGVSIRRQSRSDLLWIRDDFLDDQRDHGKVVVHGHSISADVEMRDNRIGIDTGAYRTGILTALYLDGTDREVIATGAADRGGQEA